MKSWRSENALSQTLEALKKAQAKNIETDPIPTEVSQWLSKLILLGEVPLAYLVVDERELPIESIRFFTMDTQWLQTLVDGASSIGVLTNDEAEQSAKRMPAQFYNAKAGIRIHRYGKMHPNHQRENSRMSTDSQTILSGFLMRSDLVSNWNGIEVKGFLGNSQRDILRMEMLSDKLLICIFEGEIDSVRMYEPKEVLHFGTRSENRKIDVRRIDAGHEGEPLYLIGTKDIEKITVPTTENGRLKVTELRENLSKALNAATDEIDSPQLALEMLSVAGQCVFKRGT